MRNDKLHNIKLIVNAKQIYADVKFVLSYLLILLLHIVISSVLIRNLGMLWSSDVMWRRSL